MMQAWFIDLPGWETCYYPENTVKAEHWLGSQINKVDILVDDKKNPEIEALMTLKAIGAYSSDYQLKQQDEHWVLYRAPREEKYFSFRAHYRVSLWKTNPIPS